MADFPEIMRKLDRMCQHYQSRPVGCMTCPLAGANNPARESCFHYIRLHPLEALEIIQRWNREHPELIYPTWQQCFGNGMPPEPIPAEVAEKLGIKPFVKKED